MRKFVLLLLFLAHDLKANDSSSALGTGGLVPRPNSRVAMETEELMITPDRVTVSYLFSNPTNQDEETMVSFPLPDINGADIEQTISALRGTKTRNLSDLVDFAVVVNGKNLNVETEQRAWVGAKDVTPLLKELKLPLIPWFPEPEKYGSALRRLNEAQRKKMVDFDLVSKDSLENEKCDSGRGWEWCPNFQYVVRISYFWRQRFPKKSKTRIVHSYIPLKGSGVGPYGNGAGINPKAEMKALDDRGFCGSESDFFLKPPRVENLCNSLQSIDYILTTAKTWKGAISRFKLTLSGMPFVFSCFKGLKRTDIDSWEFTANDFVPTEELRLAFCTR